MMHCTVYRRDLHDGTRVATVFQYLPDNVSIWETKIAARCSYQILLYQILNLIGPMLPLSPDVFTLGPRAGTRTVSCRAVYENLSLLLI
jgi:hypothetical protein